MNRKKILFYHPVFSDGGAEKTNLLISEELSKKYEIIYISNFFSNKFDEEISNYYLNQQELLRFFNFRKKILEDIEKL